MFDIAFSELMVIAVIALVVIGPERLPKVARTLGHLLGRAQRYVSNIKADIDREIHLDELRKMRSDLSDSARDLESNFRKEWENTHRAVAQIADSATTTTPKPPAVVVEENAPLPDIVLPVAENTESAEKMPANNKAL